MLENTKRQNLLYTGNFRTCAILLRKEETVTVILKTEKEVFRR